MISRVLLPLFLFLPFSVFAHHPLDGVEPHTFTDGFLSGVAHPFLDVPHGLLFAFAALIAARYHGRLYALPFTVALALLGGVLLSLAIYVPPTTLVLLICLAIAIMAHVLLRTNRKPNDLVVAGVIAGLHGMLYGMVWLGDEPTPFVAYVLGLVLVHYLFIQGTALVLRNTVQLMRPKPHVAATALTVASLLVLVL